jgi:TRAP-type C4-dicarboxylate transport system permease large subunit
MIIYGVVTGSSVGELFIAGIGPGCWFSFSFLCTAVFAARTMDIVRTPKVPLAEV